MRFLVALAVTGALAVAAGAWMFAPALGLVVGGVEAILGAYVARYLQASA